MGKGKEDGGRLQARAPRQESVLDALEDRDQAQVEGVADARQALDRAEARRGAHARPDG